MIHVSFQTNLLDGTMRIMVTRNSGWALMVVKKERKSCGAVSFQRPPILELITQHL